MGTTDCLEMADTVGTMADQKEQESNAYTQLKHRAIGLLSRREYSRTELSRKLNTVALDVSDELRYQLSETVLDDLIELGYQSDLRFASGFVRYKAQSGNGPLKISKELMYKGVDRKLLDIVIEEEQIDFFEIAADLMVRKYSLEKLSDYSNYQKAFRYMANRGFSTDQIKYAKAALFSEE